MEYTINVHGRLVDLSRPQVMGILNVTPDSFYAGSRKQTEREIAGRTEQILAEGGTMIDVGAFSTRPGAPQVSQEEEMERLRRGLAVVRRVAPDAVVSVDTFRPDVARMAVEEYGAGIINDVSEGDVHGAFGGTSARKWPEAGQGAGTSSDDERKADDVPEMFRMVARLGVPYILMSVRPTVGEMMKAFAREVQQLRDLGAKDIILDPGFGFGKTLEQNYELMADLPLLTEMGLPLLVGVSRKSMIFRLLGTTPDGALNGTTVLNTLALERGASILRVHDVREAVEAVRMVGMIE
ncbi:MAG: dihydropteroate synthase [Prevotella sp.]|nr:dihydropteroate synthase [Prevotella sp.]MDO4933276.1 dihydropteroate synthase [Prevotella sp.]